MGQQPKMSLPSFSERETGAGGGLPSLQLSTLKALTVRTVARSSEPVKYESISALALPLYLPAVLMHMTRAMVITVLPLHLLSLGLSYDDVGLLTTIGGFGMMFGNIPAGAFITTHGPRATMLLAAGLYVVQALLASMAMPGQGQFPMMAGAFLLLGLAENTGILARQTFMGATVPKSLRGRAGSTLGGTQRFGYTVGPALGGLVAHMAGHRSAYALQAAFATASALAMVRFVPPISATQDITAKVGSGSPSPSALGEAEEPPASMVEVARRHWKVLATISVFSASLTCVRKTRELLFSLEGHEQGLSQAEVGAIAAVSYCIDAALFPVAGKLIDTKGRTWTGAASLLGSSVAFLFLLWRSLPTTVLFGIVAGAANGISAGIVLTIGADTAPPECRGHFLALFRTFSRSADILAPSVVGTLAKCASLTVAELAACGVGVAGALWARCCVQETLQKEAATVTTDAKASEVGRATEDRLAEEAKGEESEPDLECAPLKANVDSLDS